MSRIATLVLTAALCATAHAAVGVRVLLGLKDTEATKCVRIGYRPSETLLQPLTTDPNCDSVHPRIPGRFIL